MRRLALILTLMLVWLSTGCTSSDREYVRNHIVFLEKQKNPPSEADTILLKGVN